LAVNKGVTKSFSDDWKGLKRVVVELCNNKSIKSQNKYDEELWCELFLRLKETVKIFILGEDVVLDRL
jgi:DhnA family fructose-bisphosphate aldolase class Ia